MFSSSLALLLATLVFTPAALAAYSVFDNGEVLKKGHYKFTGHSQHLTDSGGGLNGKAIIDMGFNEDFGGRAYVGSGKTDIILGAMGKWAPIKETENKPMMSLNAGLVYLKDGDLRDFLLRFEPIISKEFNGGNFYLTPYASIPISFRNRTIDHSNIDDKNDIASQFLVGAQLQVEQWKNLQFIAELGIELNDSPNYIGAGAILYFDAENGFSLN